VGERAVLGGQFGVGAQLLERPGGIAACAFGDRERAELVGVVGGAVLQLYLPWMVE
jgi:hypothetical protein